MTLKPCSTPGCPTLVRSGRCPACSTQADTLRGSPAQRGYDRAHRKLFRAPVLARAGYICELCRAAPATVADHWPLSRRDLVLKGENPNDPKHGRALCKGCHDRETAKAQPGGWHEGWGASPESNAS